MDNAFIERVFEFLLYTPEAVPYLAAFAMLLVCGLGVPVPEDITLFIMGYLAYNRLANFWVSVAVCLVGVLIGDSIIYWLGRHYGPRLTKKGIFAKLLPPERMERTRTLFHKWGNKVIFAARFMPGLRAPTYFSAGTLHMPFRVFFFYDGLAAILSVPLLIGVTYHFGDHIETGIKYARTVQNGIVFLIAGIILFLVAKHFLLRQKSS